MSRFALSLFLLGVLVAGEGWSNVPQNDVVLTLLSNPVYPQLAIQARVVGDVELKLFIRRDGTVDSAEYVRGPAMLVQAATDSAKNSKFDCLRCMEATTSY
jgi:outer membrane biosynthesis protein TonB